jgi:hypothetical protein
MHSDRCMHSDIVTSWNSEEWRLIYELQGTGCVCIVARHNWLFVTAPFSSCYGRNDRGLISDKDRDFLSDSVFRQDREPIQLCIQWVLGIPLPQDSESHNSHPSSVKI